MTSNNGPPATTSNHMTLSNMAHLLSKTIGKEKNRSAHDDMGDAIGLV
ncbi:hypothetical protein X742_17130 [Mesorhizobium sp. LNHC232B00]|nr:hypothetical protein X742_17130 [Mesorhizobium sp. LNHC232B00]